MNGMACPYISLVGEDHENRIEHLGRTACVSWQHMVPTRNQRAARQFHERANSMGGARRYCRARWCRFTILGQPQAAAHLTLSTWILRDLHIAPGTSSVVRFT